MKTVVASTNSKINDFRLSTGNNITQITDCIKEVVIYSLENRSKVEHLVEKLNLELNLNLNTNKIEPPTFDEQSIK